LLSDGPEELGWAGGGKARKPREEPKIFAACRSGDATAVLALLESDPACISIIDDANRNSAHIACALDHAEVADCLYARDHSLFSAKDAEGCTPACIAAARGSLRATTLLFKLDATLFSSFASRDTDGLTPAHRAAQGGHAHVVRLLHGLDKSLFLFKDLQGRTPAHAAAIAGGGVCEQICELELRLMDDEDKEGATPAHYAAEYDHAKTCVALLFRHPTLFSARDCEKRTPAHRACQAACLSVVRALLDVDPSLMLARATDEDTPCHYAAASGSLELVKMLYAQDPSFFEEENSARERPIHHAAEAGHADVVRFLGSRAKTYREQTKQLDTVAHIAAHAGQVAVLKLLQAEDPSLMLDRRNGGDMPAHRASLRGHTNVVKFLHEADASLLSQVNDSGETVAHCAALGQQADTLVFLRDLDPALPTLLFTRNKKCETPAHWAAKMGNLEFLEIMHSASPLILSSRDSNGKLPYQISDIDPLVQSFVRSLETTHPSCAEHSGQLRRKDAAHGLFQDAYRERVFCWVRRGYLHIIPEGAYTGLGSSATDTCCTLWLGEWRLSRPKPDKIIFQKKEVQPTSGPTTDNPKHTASVDEGVDIAYRVNLERGGNAQPEASTFDLLRGGSELLRGVSTASLRAIGRAPEAAGDRDWFKFRAESEEDCDEWVQALAVFT